ncbi:MAG: hypothetical protein ACI3ZC_06150 [Candidatus Cryptobacteroides sp.]
MNIVLHTLTSSLHDKNAVDALSLEFISAIEAILGYKFDFRGDDFSSYGQSDLDVIFIRTGGSEGLFKQVFPALSGNILLLTSGKSNSLAASLEILSFLKQNGHRGEVLHGSAEYIAGRIETLARVSRARKELRGQKLGIIGKPSDWLIASQPDKQAIKDKLGMELIDIDIRELIGLAKESSQNQLPEYASSIVAGLRKDAPEAVRKYVEGAINIYAALKSLVAEYDLSGLTIRCFDLLDALGNTGCLALSLLNSEGIPSSCEGDVPALLSMVIGNALTGRTGFQANPSQIDPGTGRMLLAHCTVPFNMVEKYSYNTHFESGIGVAIHGEMAQGDVTIFKTSADLRRMFCEEANLIENQYGRDLCRTQVLLQMKNPGVLTEYFLRNPIGNHHIIFSGKHREIIEEFMKSIGLSTLQVGDSLAPFKSAKP